MLFPGNVYVVVQKFLRVFCFPEMSILFTMIFYSVFQKCLCCFSEILVVRTFLKSDFFCRARPESLEPPSQPDQSCQEAGPQASQVNHAGTPKPRARPGPPGQSDRSYEDPQAGRNDQFSNTVEVRVPDEASC